MFKRLGVRECNALSPCALSCECNKPLLLSPTMLCSRVAFITRSRHLLHCRSILRSQNATLHPKPELIFEHAELLAVNKPPGIPFHSTDNIAGLIPTLRCMEAEGLLPHLGPLYPLHRSSPAQLSHSTSCMLPVASTCVNLFMILTCLWVCGTAAAEPAIFDSCSG